jgi:hypothetical protein
MDLVVAGTREVALWPPGAGGSGKLALSGSEQDQVLGDVVCELMDPAGRCYERIRGALLYEALAALPPPPDPNSPSPPPSGAALRQTLSDWVATTSPVEIELETLRRLEAEFYEFAHKNPTELGLVGRLHRDVTGRAVDLTNVEPIMTRTSSTVVLGLALRRFILLCGRGYTVRIAREPLGAKE